VCCAQNRDFNTRRCVTPPSPEPTITVRITRNGVASLRQRCTAQNNATASPSDSEWAAQPLTSYFAPIRHIPALAAVPRLTTSSNERHGSRSHRWSRSGRRRSRAGGRQTRARRRSRRRSRPRRFKWRTRPACPSRPSTSWTSSSIASTAISSTRPSPRRCRSFAPLRRSLAPLRSEGGPRGGGKGRGGCRCGEKRRHGSIIIARAFHIRLSSIITLSTRAGR
jgi:hypothetical protein